MLQFRFWNIVANSAWECLFCDIRGQINGCSDQNLKQIQFVIRTQDSKAEKQRYCGSMDQNYFSSLRFCLVRNPIPCFYVLIVRLTDRGIIFLTYLQPVIYNVTWIKHDWYILQLHNNKEKDYNIIYQYIDLCTVKNT